MLVSPQTPQRRRWECMSCSLLAFGVVVAMGALLWPAYNAAWHAARRSNCVGQNKMFALAMHNYHDLNGCFPPAYIADKHGQPAHSWRVLLLPVEELAGLYDRYHFDEPWNGPHNRELAGGLPVGMSGVSPWYHCAVDRGSDSLHTSYVMVVGPNTISPGAASRTMKEITNGGFEHCHGCRNVGVGYPLDGASRFGLHNHDLQDQRHAGRRDS